MINKTNLSQIISSPNSCDSSELRGRHKEIDFIVSLQLHLIHPKVLGYFAESSSNQVSFINESVKSFGSSRQMVKVSHVGLIGIRFISICSSSKFEFLSNEMYLRFTAFALEPVLVFHQLMNSSIFYSVQLSNSGYVQSSFNL